MTTTLPHRVVLPPRDIVGSDSYCQECWDYLRQTLAPLSIDVEIDTALGSVCQGAFSIVIDDVPAVYDYSDYLLVDGAHQHHRHWFRFHYTDGYRPHDNLGSFPPISFLDWDAFSDLRTQLQYDASEETILHSQSFDFLATSTTTRDRDLYQRRKQVRDCLLVEFGAAVQTDRLSQREFWEAGASSLVSVHVPGS